MLEAEFRSGRVYAYDAVPPELWLSFMATRSKGRFFNLLIRDRFRCRAVGRKKTLELMLTISFVHASPSCHECGCAKRSGSLPRFHIQMAG